MITNPRPLLIFSHQVELESCTDAIRARTRRLFRAERIGIGPKLAKQRTKALLEKYPNTTAVLVLGSAGWLVGAAPSLPVWANFVRRPNDISMRPTLNIPSDVLHDFGFHFGRLLTVSRPVVDKERARELADVCDADCVDMESHPVLETCYDLNIPCGVLRAVTDQANSRTPGVYRKNVAAAMKTLGDGAALLINWLAGKEDKKKRAELSSLG